MRLSRLAAAFVLAVWPGLTQAGQFDGFRVHADQPSLKPFCRDLGGILGLATFHSGRSLGFSGFDLGGRGGLQFRPDPDDKILRSQGVKGFGMPWVQAEIGMPFRLDGFIRGTGFQGLTAAGGGLRYGLLKSPDKPWAPQVLATLAAHSAVHRDFSASHFGGSLVGSMGVPSFTPYLGIGFDRTRVEVRTSLAEPTLDGTSVQTFESRFTAGVRFKPWTFFYLHAAYVLLHGQSGSEAGLGLRF